MTAVEAWRVVAVGQHGGGGGSVVAEAAVWHLLELVAVAEAAAIN